MANYDIDIRETSEQDLDNVMCLWNNGDVMFFVGFPEGLGITAERLKKWLAWAIKKPGRCHYSIYADEFDYCGEAFYDSTGEHGIASLDIKLLPNAQGKGIAKTALIFVIDKAFKVGGAQRVYVDPSPENTKAWVLYNKVGFVSRPRPSHLKEGDTYLEITADEWALLNK